MLWLIHTLLLGMTSASLVTIFRAIPPGSWLVKKGKPWACDICMSFWMTWGVGLAASFLGLIDAPELLLSVPAYIVCLWLLKQTSEIEFGFKSEETKEKETDHVRDSRR